MTDCPRAVLWIDAVARSELTAPARALALAYWSYMDNGTAEAWPGTDALAQRSGLSRRAVITHRAALVAAGWIRVVDPGGGRTHTMHVVGVVPNRAARAPIADPPARERVHEVRTKGARGAPELPHELPTPPTPPAAPARQRPLWPAAVADPVPVVEVGGTLYVNPDALPASTFRVGDAAPPARRRKPKRGTWAARSYGGPNHPAREAVP